MKRIRIFSEEQKIRRREYNKQYSIIHRKERTAYAKLWRDANLEKVKESARKYQQNHIKKQTHIKQKKIYKYVQPNANRTAYLITWRKQDYIKHAEERKSASKDYYAKHKNKLKESNAKRAKEWAINHPDRAKEHGRISSGIRRAKLYNAPGNGVTLKQWKQLCEEYNYRCVYCGKKGRMEMDHIVPVSKGGAHDISNITVSCKTCNRKKTNNSLLRFLYNQL